MTIQGKTRSSRGRRGEGLRARLAPVGHRHGPGPDRRVGVQRRTYLKKCYFETYRFSEDLDFTLVEGAHAEPDALRAIFAAIAERTYEAPGIEIPREQVRFHAYQTPRGSRAVEGRIDYQGPRRAGGDPPRVKIGPHLGGGVGLRPRAATVPPPPHRPGQWPGGPDVGRTSAEEFHELVSSVASRSSR
jgi:hypothetical protein